MSAVAAAETETLLRPIALVGLPGAGKSTVARELAQRLHGRCVNLDAEVEARAGRDVASIFAAEGEAGFRRRERAALQSALETGALVIDCGGGLLTDAGSAALLFRCTTVVWLDAPDRVLLQRLADGPRRPLLEPDPPEQLRLLRLRRARLYARAQARIDAMAAPVQVAQRVLEVLGL